MRRELPWIVCVVALLSIVGVAVRDVVAGGADFSRAGLTAREDRVADSLLVTGSLFALAEVSRDSSSAGPADSVAGVPAAIVPIDSLGRAFDVADSVAAEASRDSVDGAPGSSARTPRQVDKPPSEAWTTIRSGIVPGWGQLVNRKPLKAGLCFGAWAFLGAQALAAESDRQDAQEAFDMTGSVSDMNAVNDAVDRRNSRLWWMGGVAIFSMLDAYVDVHFWGFEEQWKARVEATGEGEGRLSLGLQF